MNEKIVEMVKLAIENGAVSQKHRDLILNKAKEVGEDPDLVEIYLDNEFAKLSDSKTSVSKDTKGVKTCPHCGATITDTMLSCPECGFVFQRENKASEDVNAKIEELQKRLDDAALPRVDEYDDDAPIKRMVMVVRSFSLPYTKEGLIQLLELSYSNYVSTVNTIGYGGMRPLRKAWYGKTIKAINSLSRFEDSDPEIHAILSKYRSLVRSEKRKIRLDPVLSIGAIVFIGLAIPISFGIRKDNAAVNEMNECLELNDFSGARAAIQKYSGTTDDYLDEISVQEIKYLLSNEELQQARTVAASIKNPETKKDILKVIDDEY